MFLIFNPKGLSFAKCKKFLERLEKCAIFVNYYNKRGINKSYITSINIMEIINGMT